MVKLEIEKSSNTYTFELISLSNSVVHNPSRLFRPQLATELVPWAAQPAHPCPVTSCMPGEYLDLLLYEICDLLCHAPWNSIQWRAAGLCVQASRVTTPPPPLASAFGAYQKLQPVSSALPLLQILKGLNAVTHIITLPCVPSMNTQKQNHHGLR